MFRKVAGAWKSVAPLVAPLTALPADVAGTDAEQTTAIARVAPTGGIPPYSYAWTKTAGGAVAADAPAAATTTFTATALVGGAAPRTANFRCTVTDSIGTVVQTVDVPG